MRKRTSWLLGPAGALRVLACLCAVPLVYAAARAARPQVTPHAVAHAARLRACTIVGTQGNDTLVGTPGPDVICARAATTWSMAAAATT